MIGCSRLWIGTNKRLMKILIFSKWRWKQPTKGSYMLLLLHLLHPNPRFVAIFLELLRFLLPLKKTYSLVLFPRPSVNMTAQVSVSLALFWSLVWHVCGCVGWFRVQLIELVIFDSLLVCVFLCVSCVLYLLFFPLHHLRAREIQLLSMTTVWMIETLQVCWQLKNCRLLGGDRGGSVFSCSLHPPRLL